MSENLKNLFIVLIIAGIIVYITNTVPKNTKQQENFLGRLFGFSKLDTLVDGIDNMDSKELDEYEKTLDDDKVEDIVNELNSDIEEDEINPVEEETNYGLIDEMDEEIDLNDKKINSNASSKLILNEINQDENDEETNDENLQQLENEEEFRQYLSKGNNSETKKDDYQVGPFVDDELQKFLLSEEGEMENIKTSKNALLQDETNMESKYFDEEVDNEVFMEEDEDNVKQYLDYTDEEETLNEIIHRRDNKRFTNIEQIQKYLSKKYSSISQEYPEMLPYIIEKLKDELSSNPNGLTADIINKVIKSIVGNYNKDELDEENNNYIKPFAEEEQYNEEILNEDEFSYLDEEKLNNNYIQEEKPYDEEISYEDIIEDEDDDDIKKYYKQGTLHEEELPSYDLEEEEEEVNYGSIDVEEELDEEMRVWDEKLQNIKETRDKALKDVVTNLGNTIYEYDETIDEEVPIKKINKQVLSDILNHVDDLIPHYTTDETNDEEFDEEMISNTVTSKTNIRKELLDKVLIHLDDNDTVDEDSDETNDESDKSNQIKKTLKVIKKYLNKTTTDDETSNTSNLADEIYQEKYLKAQKDLKIDNDNNYQSYYNEEENDEMVPKEELYPQEFIKDEEAHNEDIKLIVVSLGKSLSNYHYKEVDHEDLEEENVKEIVNSNTNQAVVDHVIKKINKLDVHYSFDEEDEMSRKEFQKSSIINILKHINENEDEYEDENKDIPHTNVLVMGTLSKVFKHLESETLPVEEYDFEEEEMKYRMASNIYMEEEALPQERYMISEERMGRAEMEERLSRPEMEERMVRPEMEERMVRPEMEERMVRPEMEEKLRVPVSLEKPIVNQEIIDTDQKWKKNKEIIDSKSKNEMKKRLQHQVKCGTFINPKYQKRISGCGTKAIMKLHKPNNKKLNELRDRTSEDVPKAIKDVYNDAIPKFDISKDNTCQHVQKGVTMKSCSSRFQLIGEETPSSVDNIFSNDSCFDPYSNFE